MNHILSYEGETESVNWQTLTPPHPHGWACDLVPHKDMNKNSKVIDQLFKW